MAGLPILEPGGNLSLLLMVQSVPSQHEPDLDKVQNISEMSILLKLKP